MKPSRTGPGRMFAAARLVPRRVIESADPPAGSFRAHAVGRGRIPAPLLRDFGIYCVDTTTRTLALTYDDGPDPASTPRVLDVLAENGATATFFVLAESATRYPSIVRRIAAEGHEVALHGRGHRSLLTMRTSQASRMIAAARAVVENVAEEPVALYRPPYGEHTMAQGCAVRRLGLRMVIWSGHAQDWIDDDPRKVADRALASVFPGAVILLHDSRADPENVEPGERLPDFDRGAVLERILHSTRARGYRTATVSELMKQYPIVHSMARERMVRP